jgi:hypothetical protein
MSHVPGGGSSNVNMPQHGHANFSIAGTTRRLYRGDVKAAVALSQTQRTKTDKQTISCPKRHREKRRELSLKYRP